MHKIRTIIKKEWAEVFRNRMVLFTVIFLPLLLTAIPLIMLYSTLGSGSTTIGSTVPKLYRDLCPAGLSDIECFQSNMINTFMLMFMIIPVTIPTAISAYSIVGEKTTHSLEP